jgi:hypothetical protein
VALERGAVTDADPHDEPGHAQVVDEAERFGDECRQARRRQHVGEDVPRKNQRGAPGGGGGGHHVAHLAARHLFDFRPGILRQQIEPSRPPP